MQTLKKTKVDVNEKYASTFYKKKKQTKKYILRILLVAGSVLILIGVILMTWMLLTEDDRNVIVVNIDGKIPAEQLPDNIGSGGGLTEVSWADIKDKPFYEMGFNYEWDGNTERLESFNIAGVFNFYKVSSDVPSKEELTGAITSAYFDGDPLEGIIGAGQIVDFIDTDNGNFAILFGGQLPLAFVISIPGEDSAMGMTVDIPSTGTGLWFMSANEGEFTQYIKSAENIIKTLDKKFLPDDIGGGSVKVEDVEGLLVETISEKTTTLWEYSDDVTHDLAIDLGGMF